ncbi:hypothetical protein AB0C52_13040 [Streptomyces sp. NPDC048717]|uniref:hypothetical protein n=1 Tax=Streptomyces sp. NPDC048717 TaxID=3154928 RepID=UPI00342585F3
MEERVTAATAPLSPTEGRGFWQESLFAAKVEVDAPVPPENKARPAHPRPRIESAPDLSHTWLVAAEIQVEARVASIADFRGSFRVSAGQRVEALEVYCRGCRRPYEDVKGTPCEEKVDNKHLIGGDQSIRKKRKLPPPPRGVTIVPGDRVQRRGIGAYMAGVSRPR